MTLGQQKSPRNVKLFLDGRLEQDNLMKPNTTVNGSTSVRRLTNDCWRQYHLYRWQNNDYTAIKGWQKGAKKSSHLRVVRREKLIYKVKFLVETSHLSPTSSHQHRFTACCCILHFICIFSIICFVYYSYRHFYILHFNTRNCKLNISFHFSGFKSWTHFNTRNYKLNISIHFSGSNMLKTWTVSATFFFINILTQESVFGRIRLPSLPMLMWIIF